MPQFSSAKVKDKEKDPKAKRLVEVKEIIIKHDTHKMNLMQGDKSEYLDEIIKLLDSSYKQS
eukprot:CAMPEP_0176365590 /NCGR_PEP_ID=MMETSP0126-20121128/20592_1 /TAXON_ID=141414 ORGANISM="Strombidinopsis acuminatum, Strain SPMC142" /NCGR_SAMPLE_ID=MMETSP0126 /ASSEMBLY_ACC=CAM_ASM_000229 /LENGTH=61 /DNA_ID=CAMNT_0017722683 /DNA_START=1123 /DNA_END=1308 /DNA_ORIENTATION=+